MSTSKLQRPFQRVDDTEVYVSYPQKSNVDSANGAPRVILVLGWMEASLSQIHKFTEAYHQIYPSATQIVVRAVIKQLFSELSTNKPYVLPVIKLLHDAGIRAYDRPETSGLLVHTISTGGAMSQMYIAHCLADTCPAPPPKGSALPAQAVVYDSVPSIISYSVFFEFFTTGLKSPVLRTIAKPFLVPAYAGAQLYKHTIDRRPDTFATTRSEMSNSSLVPQDITQVYIYGSADLLTPPESVEKYVVDKKERLRKEGVNGDRVIRAERFEGSPHVSHAKVDSKRYWKVVMETWESSLWNGRTGESVKPICKL
ncbi:indole-diterpene biosynthesis protein PaxU [Ceratobasidium sp. AG-Ba]|nr:indole-diterpene biosynthesis protein PaxU [Ceratobasidium sp. AG-Ba]